MNDLTADEQPLLLRFRHRSSPLPLTSSPLDSSSRPDSPPSSLFLEIHPEDAARMHITDGARIVASAQTATIRAIARINTRISPGTAMLATADVVSDGAALSASPPTQRRSPNIAQVVVRPA